jgi:hypothetical protein
MPWFFTSAIGVVPFDCRIENDVVVETRKTSLALYRILSVGRFPAGQRALVVALALQNEATSVLRHVERQGSVGGSR